MAAASKMRVGAVVVVAAVFVALIIVVRLRD